MKKLTILVAAMTVGCLFAQNPAPAQTEKTLQRTDMQGQTVESPYVTYSEFENICIDGRGRMGKLLTVRSIEEAVQTLGEPESRKVVEINSGGYKKRTTLLYAGMKITYLETFRGVQLEKLKMTSPDRFLEVGGTKVHPGMRMDELSAPLRTELSKKKLDAKNGKIHTNIFIKKGNGKEKKDGQVMKYSEIRISLEKKGKRVKSLVFSKVI